MNIAYFEDGGAQQLLPLTWLRACFELCCGRDRLIDKAVRHLRGRVVRLYVREYLLDVVRERTHPHAPDPEAGWCLLNARALVTGDVDPPGQGVAWLQGGHVVAAGVRPEELDGFAATTFQEPETLDEWLAGFRVESAPGPVQLVDYPWELPLANANELHRQCRFGGNRHGHIHTGVHLIRPVDIYIGPGAVAKPGVVLDAENGPIDIAEHAIIEPNAVLQGPCYIGPESVVQPGAVIRAGTTIGPACKVGGEISLSIIHGCSNKQHDGFLGHSYVGEWVNLGADTVTSNLKNTYGTVRVAINGVGVETGQHFVGATIGDHSKTGIGTRLPTGCILGVAANVFTQHTVPKFVPSFAWLTDEGLTAFQLEKAIQIAHAVMGRRDLELTPVERRLLEQVAALARQVEAAGWQ